jgi:opacity protein-like surface antigen
MKKLLVGILSLSAVIAQAQSERAESPLTISGYIEAYYTYDFGKPQDNNRPSFVYSFNRHNEVNVNLGFIKAAYQKDRVRANLALAAGTYMNANYAAEPGVLKNIFEANAGVKISKEADLWVDAGIFASHIGFESAIGKDCWNLTRGILADNSPYYEAGARMGYNSPNGKWYLSVLLLNGWQRIQRVDGNSTPAFGHQLTFKPSRNVTLNSSSFIGNDKPDSLRRMRYFHNFYGIFQLTEKLGLITGFDIGWEQQSKGSSEMNTWYTPIAILRYAVSEKVFVSARGEYYSDPNQVIISTASPTGFKTWGYSGNVDYLIRDNIMWRLEARGFSGEENTFTKDGRPSSNDFFLATSLAVSF